MPDDANPYIPGQPATSPDRFFGRRDVVPSIREHLLKGRRVFLVAGEPRLGKTSALHQLLHDVPAGFLPVRLDLREEAGQPLDTVTWHVARAVAAQARRATGAALDDPPWADFQARTDSLFDRFWPAVRQAVGGTCVVLLADDVDALDCAPDAPGDRLLSLIEAWRDLDADVALVAAVTAGADDVVRRHPRLFGGALTYTLGPLQTEEALRLITWPVDGAMTYDYGVARRIVEVTSGHPYYLQLVCFEVYHRCSVAGWVNQRDVDLVVDELARREISDFRDLWQVSSPPEQAAMAAMVSLRGARGVATVLEVRTALHRAGARVERERVAEILDHLVARGVLERLGALSYRFRVALLRDWLGHRVDVHDSVRGTRWDAPLQRPAPPARRAVPSRPRRRAQALPAGEQDGARVEAAREAAGEAHVRRRVPWLGLGVVALVILAAALVAFVPGILPGIEPRTPAAPIGSPTTPVAAQASSLPVAHSTPPAAGTGVAVASSPTPPAVAGATPGPTLTPSPTPPIVVARSLPAIAYQSRAEGEAAWSLCVMDSDGGGRTRLAAGQSTFLSAPSWSPGGDRIAFVSDQSGNDDIWVIDPDGGHPVNLTADAPRDHSPVWSPDGQWIVFASVRDTAYWELYIMHPDGSDLHRLTWWADASDLYPSWSPDSKRLAFASKRDGNWEIYVMDRDGSNLVRLTRHPEDDDNPAWSPDGSRIAFVSLRDGYADIFVVSAGGGEAVNVSDAPFSTDLGPTWSPDGRRLAFYSDRAGEWDIYTMAADGTDVVKLTGEGTSDQVPAWRP